MSTTTDIRVITAAAYYPMMNEDGPTEAREILTRVLSGAQERGDIAAFEVVSVIGNVYGLNYCSFTVDVDIDHERFAAIKDEYDPWMREVSDLLNRKVIGDTDVTVYVLSMVHDATTGPGTVIA